MASIHEISGKISDYEYCPQDSLTPEEEGIAYILSQLIFSKVVSEQSHIMQQTQTVEEKQNQIQLNSKSIKPGKKRKLCERIKIYSKNDPNWRCLSCNTPGNQTPLLRNGPAGSKTLCNACGVKWNRGKKGKPI